jgi:hypothetical protein
MVPYRTYPIGQRREGGRAKNSPTKINVGIGMVRKHFTNPKPPLTYVKSKVGIGMGQEAFFIILIVGQQMT